MLVNLKIFLTIVSKKKQIFGGYFFMWNGVKATHLPLLAFLTPSFRPRSEETGRPNQAKRYITLPTKNWSFCQFAWRWGQVNGICKHWTEPKAVKLCQTLNNLHKSHADYRLVRLDTYRMPKTLTAVSKPFEPKSLLRIHEITYVCIGLKIVCVSQKRKSNDTPK